MYCSVEILADCDKYFKNNYFSTKYRIISQEIRDNLNTDFFFGSYFTSKSQNLILGSYNWKNVIILHRCSPYMCSVLQIANGKVYSSQVNFTLQETLETKHSDWSIRVKFTLIW